MIEVMEYIGYAAAPTAAVWSVGVAKTGSLRPIKTYRAQTKVKQAKLDGILADTAEEDLKNVKVGASRELAIPADVKAPPVYEVWDHPAPPIPLLASSLPSAPTGYGWEITTAPGPEGNPMLRLTLLDLKSTIEVETVEADLHIVRRWKYAADETYASFYRRAEEISGREITGYHDFGGYRSPRHAVYNTDHTKAVGRVMMANLITPLVDWARILVLRYIAEHPDETKTNYMLIQAPEDAE